MTDPLLPPRPAPRLVLPEAPPIARVLWLPALGVPAAKYTAFAHALAEQGFVVALHEWRGTGECARQPARSGDWGYREWLCEDIPLSRTALERASPGLPTLIAGHSIGGQMAVLAAALGIPADGLVAVASGVPHWRLFPKAKDRLTIGGFGALLPVLTRVVGHYPGHRLGFAGREAGQVMRDWAATVRRGHYAGLKGLPEDLMRRLRDLTQPMLGLRFDADAWVPPASLEALFDVTSSRQRHPLTLGEDTLGCRADHFAWMRKPAPVAAGIAEWWRRSAGLSS